jgi:ubiquitin-like modifier-activating enzyme 5
MSDDQHNALRQIEELRKKVQSLTTFVEEARNNESATNLAHSSLQPPGRIPIQQMSAEVVDSNPYSRLMALKRMGIVENYEVTEVLFDRSTL